MQWSPSRASLAALVLAVAGLPLAAQEAAAPPVTAYINGRVATPPQWQLEAKTVLVQGDRIHAVQDPGAPLPEGATTVDLKGATIAPAWIDARSAALFPADARGATSAGTDTRAEDLFLAFEEERWSKLRAHGIGLVYADPLPRPGAPLGGAGAIARPVAKDGWPEVVQSTAGVSATLIVRGGAGGDGAQVQRGPRGQPFIVPGENQRAETRDPLSHRAALRSIETAFSAAERYRKEWEKYAKDKAEYEKKLAEWEKSGAKAEEPAKASAEAPAGAPARGAQGLPDMPEGFRDWPRERRNEWLREQMARRRGGSTPEAATPAAATSSSGKPKPPLEPKRDEGHEHVLKVLDGAMPLRCEAHWREEIESLLQLAERKSLKLVLIGATEAAPLAERLAKAKVAVILGQPRRYLGAASPLRGTATPDLAAKLAAAGVPIAFGTADVAGFGATELPLLAALAVGEGLPLPAALTALTHGAAELLGLKDRGQVAAGQSADLQVVTGDLLDPSARTVGLVLGGRWMPVTAGEAR